MYEIDGTCHAGVPSEYPRIGDATPLEDGMLLVGFASGERRLFDTTQVTGPAFASLRDGSAQPTMRDEHGFVSWLDGEVDLAPRILLRALGRVRRDANINRSAAVTETRSPNMYRWTRYPGGDAGNAHSLVNSPACAQ
ncbi:MAG: hypothetical protein IKG18_02320 [Atopobiaceae bacterium]|nr:hypothetical protein [Atopobiaceae bacterium]